MGALRWLRRLASSQPRLIVETTVALLLAQVLGLAPALAFSIVIDKVVGNQAVATLIVVAVALAAAAACEQAFGALRRALQAELRRRLADQGDASLFDAVVVVAGSEAPGTGRPLAERLERIAAVRETLVEGIDAILVAPAMLALVFAFMCHLDARMAALAAAVTIAHAAVLFAARARQAEAGRAARDAMERSRALAAELGDGLATLRSFGAVDAARRDWLAQARVARDAADAAGGLRWRLGAVAMLKNRLLFAAVIAIGAFEVIGGQITVGGFVAFTMLLRQFAAAFEAAIPHWQRFAETHAWIDQIDAAASAVASARVPAPALAGHRGRGAVALTRVGFGYARDRDLLAGLDLEIRPGEAIGIVGSAGCGKSSLLRLMAGLARPRRGIVAIDGHDLASLDPGDLGRSVRLVEQEPRLFRGTLLDNLRLGDRDASITAVETAVRLAGAQDIVDGLPGRYGCVLDDRRLTLSVGERQRLCLARALVTCPPVLLIDDIGAAIGGGDEEAFLARLAAMRENRTIVLVTASRGLLAGMDRVIAIRGGRLIAVAARPAA